ncbi:MAG: sulfatase [Pirellulales bacterium]
MRSFPAARLQFGACFAICLCAMWVSPAARAADSQPRPNVLFIAVDDLNHWVGHLGRNKQAKTPQLDRLAKLGVTFTHAYCAAPVCNPSRAALMSGMRPGATGVYSNGDDWRPVVAQDLTLLSTFRHAGYRVTGAGKIYHGAYERDSEWDDYLHSKGGPHPTKPIAVPPISGFGPADAPDSEWSDYKSVDYGIAELSKEHAAPFFLAVGLHKPHMPWSVPRKYFDMHPLESIELPPTRADDLDDVPSGGLEMARANEHERIVASGHWKAAVQAYLAAGSFADAQIGRLLDALENAPERDNTIVVLWGDHGWHLGEKHHWRKFALWEEATRAPLIWIVPGVTQPGTRCDRTVDFMSIYPTLCDLCGIKIPQHVQGRSIRSLLADPASDWKSPAITTFGQNNHAVRSEGWRYIRYADGGEELYDEAQDPYEWTNLAADAKHAQTKADLQAQLPTQNEPNADGKKNKREAKRARRQAKSNP